MNTLKRRPYKTKEERKDKSISFRVSEDIYNTLKKFSHDLKKPINTYARDCLEESLDLQKSEKAYNLLVAKRILTRELKETEESRKGIETYHKTLLKKANLINKDIEDINNQINEVPDDEQLLTWDEWCEVEAERYSDYEPGEDDILRMIGGDTDE